MAYGQLIGSTLGGFGGSFIPIPGASLLGSTLGGLAGGYFDQPSTQSNQNTQGNGFNFFNQPKQQYSPQQQQLQNQSIQQIMSLLQGGPQQFAKGFEPYAQQARQQFQTQTAPSIAERFTALGGSNRGSSGEQGFLAGAGANLEQQLALLGGQYGENRYNNQLNQLLGLATSPQFSNYTTRQSGPGENALSSLTPILAALATLYGGYRLNQWMNPATGTATGGATGAK